MDTLFQDLRYALRQLVRNRGFTTAAVLTLALGAGTNSLLYSVIHAVLLRPLPYPDPDRIVSISLVPRGGRITRMNAQATHWAYFEWRDMSRSLARLAAYRETRAILGGGIASEMISGAQVTDGFFTLLGVRPVLGRDFTADEQLPNSQLVGLLSYGLWQNRFGGDPGIIGRSVVMDGAPVTIVGVLPPTFDFPIGARFWRPLQLPTSGFITMMVHVLARLAPGVTITQARNELTALLRQSRVGLTPFLRDASVDVAGLRERLYGSTRPLLLILLGAVGFVLLIACANVASLLVARAAAREREFAIRAALGAGRLQLIRQLLIESMVLATLGAAAGLLVPVLGLRLFIHAAPFGTVQAVEVHLDGAVLAFTTALALFTGMAFGLAPALTASRPGLVKGLRIGAGQVSIPAHGVRLRESLVIAELAAAVVLLTGPGLLTRSFFDLLAVDPGFRPDHVVGVTLRRSSNSTFLQGHGRAGFYEALVQRLGGLPGVASVALADALPLGGFARSLAVRVDDAPLVTDGTRNAALSAISAGYFSTLDVAVVAGRTFTLADRVDAPPVAIVNAAFTREFLGGGNPIGHQIELPGTTPARWTIVGEVKDIRQVARDVSADPEIFLPASQAGYTPGAIAIRTNVDPEGLIETVRRAVREVDPEQPAARVFTLESELARSVAPRRDNALLLGTFAGVSLLLAAVGLAGVIAYLVAHRTQEIGVRMALGAGRSDVLRLIVGEGARLVALGLVMGLVAGVAVTRVLASFLFGVTATDPLTFLIVSLVLVVVALGAAIIPARRAMRVDPMVALRHE